MGDMGCKPGSPEHSSYPRPGRERAFRAQRVCGQRSFRLPGFSQGETREICASASSQWGSSVKSGSRAQAAKSQSLFACFLFPGFVVFNVDPLLTNLPPPPRSNKVARSSGPCMDDFAPPLINLEVQWS